MISPIGPATFPTRHAVAGRPRRARIRRCNRQGPDNMKAALPLLIFITICTLTAQASLRYVQGDIRSYSNTKRFLSLTLQLRGGEDKSKGDDESNTATVRFWSSNSLHRLNEVAMKEAQSDISDSIPHEKKPPKKKGQPHQKRKTDPAQNGRGGALVKQQPQKKPPPRLIRWLVPPSPSETTENQQERAVIRNTKPSFDQERNPPQSATEVPPDSVYADLLARLWWVNVWTQQLPDRPDDYLETIQSAEPVEEASTKIEDSPRKKKGNNNVDNERQEEVASKKSKNDSTVKTEPTIEPLEESNELTNSEIPMDNATATLLETESVLNMTPALSEEPAEEVPDFVSSGYWAAIDGLLSLGLSGVSPAFRISRPLRPIRKATARVTGLHGVLSGKPTKASATLSDIVAEQTLDDEDLAMVRRRIAAINKAREKVAQTSAGDPEKKRGSWWGGNTEPIDVAEIQQMATAAMTDIPSIRKTREELEEEETRMERVQEIDKLMSEAQSRLMELACEKDVLQRRPNPLWNYTTEKVRKRARQNNETTVTTRKFSFPPEDLVEEYLDILISSGRLVKLNHTDLWQKDSLEDDDDDETIGDELISSSFSDDKKQRSNGNGGSGSWLLRQSLGKGSTLGEKIGEAAEQAAYKSIAKAVMEALAKGISAIHGVNIMSHTDIRLSMEATPDLPPMSKEEIIPGGRNSNYARDALQGAMRRGARKHGSRRHRYRLKDDDFVQRDAVVETLLSHCQISAPLLKLFPLAWQRAMLGNVITLITAVVADFCEGVQFEILGHRLSFSFKPITESDMINHIAMGGGRFKRQSAKSEQFEAAVLATANDLGEKLKFLDRWHERALGSGMLRSQLANLIARLVLTLADEVLAGAQMDLWAAQAGGPRMVAGLEHRTIPSYMEL